MFLICDVAIPPIHVSLVVANVWCNWASFVLFGVSWLFSNGSSLFIVYICFFSWLSSVLVSEVMWLPGGVPCAVVIGVSLLIANHCSLLVVFLFAWWYFYWSVCNCCISSFCTRISCSSCFINCCCICSWVSWVVLCCISSSFNGNCFSWLSGFQLGYVAVYSLMVDYYIGFVSSKFINMLENIVGDGVAGLYSSCGVYFRIVELSSGDFYYSCADKIFHSGRGLNTRQ